MCTSLYLERRLSSVRVPLRAAFLKLIVSTCSALTPYDSVTYLCFFSLSQAAAMKRHATNAMGSRASYKLVVQFISNIYSQLLSHIINEAFFHNLIYTTMLYILFM